ncbi:cold shock-like protein CspD [Erwinia tracheiphila PSU-1]|nr:cold shock-like protein CspD [Erwinia tracheiphila PSU-1]
METGTVKWFNNAKGFGFICPVGGGDNIFAYYSTIQDGWIQGAKGRAASPVQCAPGCERQSCQPYRPLWNP